MVIKLNMPKDDEAASEQKPAEPQAPAAEDNTVLKDGSTESLSRTFKALTEQGREQRAPFRPTLAKLNEIVSRFQGIGLDQVGIELATFDRLREFNLIARPGGDGNPFYGILSIYDARFLIRVYPEMKIDCYTENLNKPALTAQSLDSDEFWYKSERSSGGSVKINRAEPKFLPYNLAAEDEVTGFMSAILQTAATCAANEDLKEFDLPAARETRFVPKAAGLKSLKP
jgi:hypothetical protein